MSTYNFPGIISCSAIFLSGSLANLSGTASYSSAGSGSYTGSFSGSFTGSMLGTSSYSLGGSGSFTGSYTGSLFGTSSYAQSSSYTQTASYILGGATVSSASYASFAVSGNGSWTGSFTGSFSGSISGSDIFTNGNSTIGASQSCVINIGTGLSSSIYIGGGNANSFVSIGTAANDKFNVNSQTIILGNNNSNATILLSSSASLSRGAQITGSTNVSGNFFATNITGSSITGSMTGSLLGTSSYALTYAGDTVYLLTSSTVNWSNGLIQYSFLTGSTFNPTFSNPVSGKAHVLILSSSTTTVAVNLPSGIGFDPATGSVINSSSVEVLIAIYANSSYYWSFGPNLIKL